MERTIKPDELLRHLGWMRALARSLLRDDHLAEDAVQETLLAAVRWPPRRQAALGAWLRTALRRFALRARWQEERRRRREVLAARAERLSHEPDLQLETLEVQRQLIDEVLRLEEPYRSTVILRYFEEFSLAEIARRHRVDESTARWRLKTAIERLRASLTARNGRAMTWEAALAPLLEPSLAGPPGDALGPPATSGGEMARAFVRISRPTATLLAGASAMKLKVVLLAGLLSVLLAGLLVHHAPTLLPGQRGAARQRTAPASPVAARVEPPAAEPSATVPTPSTPHEGAAFDVQPPPGSLAGRITSAATGQPIPGGWVLVRGTANRAVSGESGEYTLEGLSPGEHFVVASAAGHAEQHARLRLSAAAPFRRDFRLDPAVEIVATVSDPDGRPLAGVEVTPAQPNRDFVHDEVYTRITGPDGTALLSGINRNDPPQVNARKPGFSEVWTRDYRIEAEAGRAELRIVLEPRPVLDRIVMGKVTDTEGKPLEGVHVQWIHSHGEQEGRQVAATGRAGRYRIAFPSEKDRVTLSAYGAGWAPVIRSDVRPGTPGEPAVVDFELEPGHWLEGLVADEEGRPVEKATLNAMPTLGTLRNVTLYPGNLRSTVTDAKGRFRLDDLSGPAVAIQLRGPEGGDWAHNMNETVEVDREARLVLERWKAIRGRVKDADTGEPITHFNVKLKKGVGYYDYKRCDPGESFHAADGRFLLARLDPDRFTFTVEAEGYISVLIEDVPASVPVSGDEVAVEMTRGAELEGIVVDRDAGTPIAGARIAYGVWKRGDLAWDSGALESMMNRQEAITGADGAFRVIEAEAGTVFVRARGYARTAIRPQAREAFADAAGRLVVALERGAVLRGVLYQGGEPCRTGFFVLSREPGGGSTGAPGIREWLGNLDRDDRGAFQAEDLAPGNYTLAHYRETPGKRAAGLGIHRRVEVEAGRETFVEFGKDHGGLVYAGRIVDQETEPLDEVHLELEPAFEWPYTRFRSYVKRSHGGRFYFEGLRPGNYRARLTGRNDLVLPLPELELRSSAEDETVVVRDR